MATPATIDRTEIVATLVKRDGTMCQFPGEEHELDFIAPEGKSEVTIDHWQPQWYGKSEGWTPDQIWDISNLKLMCKKHNAKKGDRVPNEDGTLPAKPQTKFRYRRDKRAGRADFCEACDNGHNLASDEMCASCGCNAQRFPRWAKVRPNECDHELMWCWCCSIGVIERTASSVSIAMRQADSTELGEFFSEEALDTDSDDC